MNKLERLRRKVAEDVVGPKGDKTTAKILEVAADLFADQGFAATSLDQIIAAGGVGRASLYRRFTSKLELFLAVVRHCRQKVDKRFSSFAEGGTGDPLERLRAALRWLLDVNLEPRLVAFQRIAFSESAVTGTAIEDAPNQASLYLVEAIAEAQAAGQLGDGDPAAISAFLVNAIIIGPLTRAMLGDQQLLSCEARDAVFDQAWTLAYQGVKACS